MINGILLDYNRLRKNNTKSARQVVLEVLKDNKNNISKTAEMLNTSRHTVYKCIRKEREGNLEDKSRAPKHIHNKTDNRIEKLVIGIKKRTRYGPIRIQQELEDRHKIHMSVWTIRNIVRRNRDKIKIRVHRVRRGKKREFIDWYKAKPFEIVQIDLKYIVDKKALNERQIENVYARNLPLYQWSAVDVNSRFKLIAYSNEKSWTNGLTWYL